MKLSPAYASDLLPFNRDGYKVARIAAMARIDTIYGGAKALRVARHCTRWDASSVVADVYSASTGKHHTDHEAWKCPECGQVWLGQSDALLCCNPVELEDPNEPEDVPYNEDSMRHLGDEIAE